MKYPYNPKSNPKRFYLYALCLGCIAVGACFFFFTSTLVAVIATVIGMWTAWAIFSAFIKVQSARIDTYTEGFTAYTSNSGKFDFIWNEITHAGIVSEGEYKGTVFVYAESSDKIVQLPPVFVNFDLFIEELKQNSPWKNYDLKPGETIVSHLKEILGVSSKPDSETETDTI